MAVFNKTLKKHIFIHPGDQHKIHTAIRGVLMRDRKKYSDRMEGALLDVSNIKVIGDRHLVVHGHLSMEVMADFQIFAPTVGMTLQGHINKVHKKYCGCVTMDFFNVTLSYPQDFYLTPTEGDRCSFVVQSLIINGDLLHMRGLLTSIDEEHKVANTSGADSDLRGTFLSEDSKREPKEISQEGGEAEIDDESFYETTQKKAKKKKKKKSIDDYDTSIKTETVGSEENSLLEITGKSSKKKHKKKIKEETMESSINTCDNALNLETKLSDGSFLDRNDTDSLLENRDERSKKKHKKKSKENSLESSVDFPDLDISVKTEMGYVSLTDGSKSSKKKHKKKSRENALEWSPSNGNDTSMEVELDQTGDSGITENGNCLKKEHRIKSEVGEEFDSSNAMMGSDFNDSLLSQSPKTKSKKKHKKRSHSDDELVEELDAEILSPVAKIKKER